MERAKKHAHIAILTGRGPAPIHLANDAGASEHRHLTNDAGASTATQSGEMQGVPAAQSGEMQGETPPLQYT